MSFDIVHDIQKAYRKVVDSMSRPGLISDLSEEALKFDLDIDIYNITKVLMFMFLDQEVTHYVIGQGHEEISNRIAQITYSRNAGVSKADYIFVVDGASSSQLNEAISEASVGNLVDPQENATIIVECESIERARALLLSGPGIKEENEVSLSIDASWMAIREKKNSEYPLGVDMIFVSKDHQLLCIPRTTAVKRGE